MHLYFEVECKRFTKLHCNKHLLKVWKKLYRYDEKSKRAIEIKNGIIDCKKYSCVSHLSKTRHKCFIRKTNAHTHVSNLYNYFESRLHESSYVKPVWQYNTHWNITQQSPCRPCVHLSRCHFHHLLPPKRYPSVNTTSSYRQINICCQ